MDYINISDPLFQKPALICFIHLLQLIRRLLTKIGGMIEAVWMPDLDEVPIYKCKTEMATRFQYISIYVFDIR